MAMKRKKQPAKKEEGQMELVPLVVLEPLVQEPPPLPPPAPEFLATLKEDAIRWASECGLRPPFQVSGPDRVLYPEKGHGYIVTMNEIGRPKPEARCRIGTARYTSEGRRGMWTIDGTPSG